MEEQITNPTPAARASRTVPLLVLLVLLAAAVVGAYIVITRHRVVSDPAGYIPREVAMAATIDFTETPEKLDAYNFINGLLKEAGQDKALDTIFEELSKELKLDFKKDVAAHLNGAAAVAVLDEMVAMPMPKVIAVIGAKSAGDADAVMTTLGNKLNAEQVAFTRSSYGSVNYYNIPMPTPNGPSPMAMPGLQVVSYVGAVRSTVVWANSESAFRKVVDTANGQPSLLSDNNYATMRKSGPKVFATTYLSGPNTYKLMEPFFQIAAMQAPPGSLDGMRENMESLLAVVSTAEASSEGIKCSTAVASNKQQGGGKPVPIDEMVAGVPKDAAVVMSIGDFAGAWSAAIAEMDKQPLQKTQFDQMVQQVKMVSGLDLRADVLDRIKSMQAYYIPRKMAQSANFPGMVNIVLQVDKPEAVVRTVQKMHALAGTLGHMPFKPLTIDGQSAYAAPLGAGGGVLTDAMVGDKLLVHISGTGGTMPAALAQVKNPGPGLVTSDAFKLVKSQLQPDSRCLYYGDVGAIIRVFSDAMSPEDRKVAESITRKVGTFGISAVSVDGHDEFEIVIPFTQ